MSTEGENQRFEHKVMQVFLPRWLPLSAIVALIVSGVAQSQGYDGIGLVSFLVFIAAGFSMPRFRLRREVLVSVDTLGLSVDGKTRLRRPQFQNPVVELREGGDWRVTVAPRGNATELSILRFEMMDGAAAHAMARCLRTLREDAYRARVFGWREDLWWKQGVALVPLFAALAILRPNLIVFLPILQFVFAFAAAFQKVTAGDDGVSIRNLFGETFLPIAHIEVVVNKDAKLLFQLRTQKKPKSLYISSPTVRLHVEAKVREAIARHSAFAIGNRLPLELERRDRPTREWLAALRMVGSSSPVQYREAATSEVDLRRVLRDQSADAIARAAAAVSLDALDPKATERIRVVAAETANPKLRIALERIADHADDAEIGARLDALEVMKR